MQQKLIIIRGNSGSGKSTVAARVREAIGDTVMLLQQDVVRLELLKVKDREGNPAIKLIEQIAHYGKSIGYDVVLEGILPGDKYSEMLNLMKPTYTTSTFHLKKPSAVIACVRSITNSVKKKCANGGEKKIT